MGDGRATEATGARYERMAARTGKASGRSALGGVMFLLVSVAVFAPAADAFKERDVIDSVMATIRNRAANQGHEQPNTLDELAELGSNLLKAFGPLIQTDGTQGPAGEPSWPLRHGSLHHQGHERGEAR